MPLRKSQVSWKVKSKIVKPNPSDIVDRSSFSFDKEISTSYSANLFGWRKRIRDRTSATTELIAEGTTGKASEGSFTATKRFWPDPSAIPDQLEEVWGVFGHPNDVPPASACDPSPALNQAKMAFISKAIQAQRQCQGLVVLGELHETLRTIRHPLQALRKSFGKYHTTLQKNGSIIAKTRINNVRKRAAIHGMISNTYLEYEFGWKNIVRDNDDAMRALAQILTYRLPSKHCSGKGEVVGSKTFGQRTNSCSAGSWTAKWSITDKVSTKIYGLVATSNGCPADTVRQSFGLTWPNFIPTLWELIPYSFVVDYFTNIGNIIDAASFNSSEVHWVNMGQYARCELETVSVTGSNFVGGLYEYSGVPSELGGHTRVENFHKSRTPYGKESLIPPLEFTLPGMRQGVNLGALIQSSRSTSRRLSRIGRL